jgi:hypothetical protein
VYSIKPQEPYLQTTYDINQCYNCSNAIHGGVTDMAYQTFTQNHSAWLLSVNIASPGQDHKQNPQRPYV